MGKTGKKYTVKPNKKFLDNIPMYWSRYSVCETLFYHELSLIEKRMARDSGIKDIEFFFCDGECAGIGNGDRTMKLIPRR